MGEIGVESLLCAHVGELERYKPPDWEALAAHAGVSPDQLVRLDANENAYGPPPRVAQALAGLDGYGLYPDYRPLTAAIADYVGVAPDAARVVLGNGGDEVIDLVVRAFVDPGQGVVVCPPAFDMYDVCTRGHRGRVLRVPRRRDFSLDVAGIEAVAGRETALADQADALADQANARLLFLTSPGNPDGQAIPLETVQRLLRLPLTVAVDEAYVEFGGESAVPLLDAHPNLVVLRTFSKWAGMAGLRLGYAIVSPTIADGLERLRLPYNVNAAAVAAALAVLNDLPHVQSIIADAIAERERLHEALASLPGVRPLPSQANFVLCRLDRPGQEVADALARRRILVRAFSDPALTDAIRITVGRPEQNDAVIAALASILANIQYPISSIQSPHAVGCANPKSQHPTRCSNVHRITHETDVSVSLVLDGTGHHRIDTGLGFLDHMLAQVAVHGLFDLTVQARGDLAVDEHHTVEDVAIGLGQALDEALGQRRGIARVGHAYAPLDEALAHVVVDLSGRPYAVVQVEFASPRVGAMDVDLIVHFMETLAVHARASLHARVLYGRNDHHKAEALFKALGRALDAATCLDARRQDIPSTKGVL